ncbi:MAG: glycosyltransferase family 2 protein [Oscillospiraceae bacterium]|nr:glycosyltransferase family 2 protein [Oscillospiraceae bacterium]
MRNLSENDLQQYHLEDEASIKAYHRWLREQDRHKEEKTELSYKPMFSVVMPVYNTVTEQLTAAIGSVLAQDYDNYELILVDDHSTWDNVIPVLKSYESNEHVHVIYRETNGHISVATNDGLNQAKGDFIVFMDCDDTIETDAFYEFAKKLNEDPELDFIYSDEDKITADGKLRHMPFFKPDWSPDLFMTMNYTNHLSVYRASLVKQTGGLRSEYNGSQDYDFVLRFMELSDNSRVGHISRILYHWRERKESVAFAKGSKNYAAEAAKKAKEECLARRGLSGQVIYEPNISQFYIAYDVLGEPLISIVIPSKDNPSILKQCIDSVNRVTKYRNYEIIVVDNGSSPENKSIIESYLKDNNAVYIYEKKEFNFSYMCNCGYKASKGEYVLFLNDDIEVFQPDWLERMAGAFQQPYIGAVGAKLLYPDSTLIQHAGVANIKEGPSHSFLRADDNAAYYFGFSKADYNCIAVTGACLMVSRKILNKINGFDESFPVAYNDVDLCYRIYESGYYIVQRNDVIAYHHESLSRGNDMLDEKKLLRLSCERNRLYAKHPSIGNKDPFMNCHLHTYSSVLDLEPVFYQISRYSLPVAQDDVLGSIDSITATSYLRIAGWAGLADEDNTKVTVNVLLRDIYGVCCRAETQSMIRHDVYEAFEKRKDMLHSGFDTIIDINIIKLNTVPYDIGIEIIDSSGISHIKWFHYKYRTEYPQKLRQFLKPEQLTEINANLHDLDVRLSIDETLRIDNGIRIKGFAILDTNNNYLYSKKIVLRSSNGKLLVFETFPDERIDVALYFPEIHFIRNSGFICYILEDLLDEDEQYSVEILFENILDNNRFMIATGKHISKSNA